MSQEVMAGCPGPGLCAGCRSRIRPTCSSRG